MAELLFADYDRRLRGCFMGKSVGGTLGMPYEGEERLLHLTYYDPVPQGMVANDDLDLQVMFLEAVRRFGLPIHREYLAQTWSETLRFVCDEYGVAQKNLRLGLRPPVTGRFDNKFYAGMGAAIRTELWACLAPGDPVLAAALAREDASIDHYDDGVEASMFLAAVESAAFVEQDVRRLLEIGLGFMRPEGRFANALHDTIRWYDELHDPILVREKILARYYVQNWTDVSINISFVVLGLIAGEGDFGRSLCTAVNCGNDTDCTGATLGALLGILDPGSIGEEWTRPIGSRLVLGGNMVGLHEVDTIDKMCDQIAVLSAHVQAYYSSATRTVGMPPMPAYTGGIAAPWKETPDGVGLPRRYDPLESTICRMPVYTTVIYPPQVSLALGRSAEYRLRFQNIRDTDAEYRLLLHTPHGFTVRPAQSEVILHGTQPFEVTVTVTAEDLPKNAYLNPLNIRLQNDDTQIEMTAGLPTAVSWWMKEAPDDLIGCPTAAQMAGARRIDAHEHFRTVPEGRWLFMTEVKDPISTRNAYLVAEGDRPVTVWVDDRPVLHTDGSYYAPAFHRGPWRGRVDLSGGWSRLAVEVGDGAPGEVFVGFAAANGFEWLDELEYRLPEVEEGKRR